MIRHAIRHRTTGAYLAELPSLNRGHHETRDPDDAVHFATSQQAEAEREGIEHFAEAWVVAEVEIEMSADSPSEAALVRYAALERQRERQAECGPADE